MWPRKCTCCFQPADSNTRVSHTLRRGTANLKTIFRVPLCSLCKAHERHRKIYVISNCSLIVLLLAGCVLMFVYSNLAIRTQIVIWAIALIACGLFFFINHLREKVRMENMQSPTCVSDVGTVSFASEMTPYFIAPSDDKSFMMQYSIAFRNANYAAAFMEANQGNELIYVR